MRVIALNKYIKMAAVILCIVIVLTISNAQTANGDKEEIKQEMVTVAINTPHTVKSDMTEKVAESALAKDESAEIKTDETESKYISYFTEEDVKDLAKLLLRECGGVESKTEQACVAWCVLNRVDKYESSIHDVVRKPNQFAFSESTEVRDDLYELANDVLERWNAERNGVVDSGRVLPREYIYFHGDGIHNYFRNAFNGNYDIWDYSLESPYED